MSNLEDRRKKLTDMLLDDILSKDAYDEKYNDFTDKIDKCKEERGLLMTNLDSQKNITKRMKDLRGKISEVEIREQFDRIVFESIVEKVVVGELKEDGQLIPIN